MVTSPDKKGLSLSLFGKTRQVILTLLYGQADETYYLRQIVRLTGAGLGPVQRELKQLTDAGIIRRSVKGRQVYYQANAGSPIFEELKNLITKTVSPLSRRFTIPKSQLTEFCRQHHIKKLSLFGSVLRPYFRPESDIDVLVEFEPGHVPGFAIVAMENELSQLVGCKIDLRTPKDLSRYFREQVIREAEVYYAAK